MRVLLDENIPHQLRVHLSHFDAATAVYMGFAGLRNGDLLEAAERSGFEVLVTGDLTLEYEQNLAKRRLAIVSLSANSWRILRNYIPEIISAIETSSPGSFTCVECGRFRRETKPPQPESAQDK